MWLWVFVLQRYDAIDIARVIRVVGVEDRAVGHGADGSALKPQLAAICSFRP